MTIPDYDKQTTETPSQMRDRYARWALLGDDCAQVPSTLKDSHRRIQVAMAQYTQAMNDREKVQT